MSPSRRRARAAHSGDAEVDRSVRKYLRGYAEPEAEQVETAAAFRSGYGHVLCIPAFGEGEGLRDTLSQVPAGPRGRVLVAAVVNETAAAPQWASEANRRSLSALRENASDTSPVGAGLELQRHRERDVLVVDRTRRGRPLPEGQGVGLARKIGADIALSLWAAGRVESPWIHCSDADVVFPRDYFARPLLGSGDRVWEVPPSACLYDFFHRCEGDPETARAALRYEVFLRYYVLGLRSAGSPYAFHTIGSTLALSPLAYARCRGFPRRKAGEDFHLLAKLAKVGPVLRLRGSPLSLSGRVSKRVPFGTGAGIAKALERARRGAPFPVYDPRVFGWLAVWLRTLDALDQSAAPVPVCLHAHAGETRGVDAALLLEVLEALGALRLAETLRGRGRRALHEGFDALRTLRLVHALRDARFPSVALEAALREAAFLPFAGDTGGFVLENAHRRLVELDRSDREARGPALSSSGPS